MSQMKGIESIEIFIRKKFIFLPWDKIHFVLLISNQNFAVSMIVAGSGEFYGDGVFWNSGLRWVQGRWRIET